MREVRKTANGYAPQKRKGKRRKPRPFKKFITVLLTMGVLAAMLYWGNSSIKTEYVTVEIEGLPSDLNGVRIAQLSDLHGKQFGRDNKKLLQAVREAEPDIIALTGDLVDHENQLEHLPQFTRELARIAPVYYVTGNHEWASHLTDSLDEILPQSGATVLHNSYSTIEGELGGEFILAGIDDPNCNADAETPPELIGRIRDSFPNTPIVLLAHRNNPKYYENLDVSVAICGHGHGGIIRLPFVGGLLGTDRALFPEYSSGLYAIGTPQMFVSRGLGNVSIELRIFNRPQLPVLILKSK